MDTIKKDDMLQVSYEEFGVIMDDLVQKIIKYRSQTEVAFDIVVPLLRSGMVPATHIVSKLDIKTVLPVYYMYLNKKIVKRTSIPELLIDEIPEKPNILIVDANLTTGTTVKNAIDGLLDVYPHATFYVAITWLDHSVIELPNVKHIFYGRKTNEMKTVSSEEATRLGLINKIIVGPWEDFDICWKEIA